MKSNARLVFGLEKRERPKRYGESSSGGGWVETLGCFERANNVWLGESRGDFIKTKCTLIFNMDAYDNKPLITLTPERPRYAAVL